MDQSGRGDGVFQRGALTECDFLAGVRFEALDEPVQGGAFVKGGDTSEKAAELVGVLYKATDRSPCLRDSRASRAAATALGERERRGSQPQSVPTEC